MNNAQISSFTPSKALPVSLALETGSLEPQKTAASQELAAHMANSQFFQLVHLIGLLHDDVNKMGAGQDPARESIRFRATRSLSFGAGDISQIHYDAAAERFDIRVNFLGLYGPSSPLPPFNTERIIEQDEAPSALEDFLDLFNHRLITLLFQIWRKSRYHVRYAPKARDPISRRFLALCGFPVESRDEIGGVPRSALLPHVGLLSLYSNSAEAAASILSNCLKVNCKVEEYVMRRVHIEAAEQMALGVRNTTLGEDVVLGEEVDDDLGKFTLRLGPATSQELEPFMPGGARHHEIPALLSMIIRDPLEWDLEFEFISESIQAGRLEGARLGETFWLASGDGEMETPVRLYPRASQSDAFDIQGAA